MAEMTVAGAARRAGLDPFSNALQTLDTRRSSLMKDSTRLSESQQRLGTEQEALIQQRGEDTAAPRQALIDKLQTPPDGTLREERVPDHVRPSLPPEEVQQTFGMLMAAAMIMGVSSRAPFYTAMNAMTGAMNGFMKQDAALVKESLETWRVQAEAIKERNASKRREVEAAWKNYQHDLAGLRGQLELIAAKYDDPLALLAARSKSIGETQKLVETNLRAVDTATERLLRDRQRADEAAQRLELQRQQRAEAAARLAETQRRNREMEGIARERLAERQREAEAKAKGPKLKKLPDPVAKDIAGRETVIDMLDDLVSRQEKAIADGKGYGGYLFDGLGNAVIKGGRALGENQDEALFFSQLESVAQPDRHALFGATLTGGEQGSWRSGWVGAGDNPQTLLNVLKQKRASYENMLNVKRKSFGRMGYDLGDGGAGPAGGTRLRFDAQGNEIPAR